MENKQNAFVASLVKTQEQGMELMDKLALTARPEAVFGPPATHGDYTVITSSEVMSGLGFGFGGGSGPAGTPADEEEQPQEQTTPSDKIASGTGGGGGGYSAARPVAVIVVSPQGVEVKPVFDLTKVALAWITAVASIFYTLGQIRRAGRRR